MKKNIILIGMRGSGKSHFGSLLSQFLDMPKIDIDEEIEIFTGKSISAIIASEGWDAFREYEHQIITKTCQNTGVIISTGGGAITFERNATVLKQSGIVVFLFAPLSELVKRLEKDTSRPALTQGNSLQDEIITIWEQRKNIYFENADVIFWSKCVMRGNAIKNIHYNAKILACRLQKMIGSIS